MSKIVQTDSELHPFHRQRINKKIVYKKTFVLLFANKQSRSLKIFNHLKKKHQIELGTTLDWSAPDVPWGMDILFSKIG